MADWLFKTEPTDFSWADLVRDRKTTWTGVRNPTALIHLRATKSGDQVLIYHTGTQRAIVGIAKITAGPRVDPADGPKSCVVDLAPVRALPQPVTLEQIKSDPVFKNWDLLRITRLSVMAVPVAMWKRIQQLADSKPERKK